MSMCTWNPNNKSSNTVLSNGDLTAHLPSQSALAFGTVGHSKGKYYFELIQNQGIRLIMGIANEKLTPSTMGLNGRHIFAYNGKKSPGANDYAESFGIGDCAGIAVDIDNGTLELFKNGVSQGIGFSDIKDLGTTIYPFVSNGTDTYGTAVVTANFGATPFQYPVDGFLAWNDDEEKAENPLELHIVLEVDEQIQLIGNVLPEMVGDPNLEWSSNLLSVASVDSTGMVTAHAEGYAHIKVKTINGEWNDFARVKVVAKGEGDKYRLSILLKTGESCLLESVFNLEDSLEEVVWTSGTPEVATVDPSNTVQTRVTAQSKGLTLVTVQTIDGSKQDQIYVTVIE